jgi:lipid A 3-O-deacylase
MRILPLVPPPGGEDAVRAGLACIRSCTLLPVAGAQTRPPQGTELQLFVENDMLARTDRYYTNGIKLGGGVPFELLQLPATEVLRQLAPEGGGTIHLGLFLGPEPIHAEVDQHQPGPALRPSLGGLALSWRRGAAGHGKIDSTRWKSTSGLVGPSALGKEVQTGWHKLIGAKQPMGWHNQIPNEPAFLVSYLTKSKHRSAHRQGLELERFRMPAQRSVRS